MLFDTFMSFGTLVQPAKVGSLWPCEGNES